MKVPQPEKLSSAQQILRACAQTYRSLYEFQGSASVVSQARMTIEAVPAATFHRNAHANFDYVRGSHFYITGHDTLHQPFEIRSTPQKTTTTLKIGEANDTEDMKDIETAVAAFTGVAAHAPTIVTALLLESNWHFPFASDRVAALRVSEIFGGHNCYVVVQKHRDQTTTLWIDAESFLLRGMREEGSEMSLPPLITPDGVTFPMPRARVLFSNNMHIFSVEKTVPAESELREAAKKMVDVSLLNVEDADH